MKYHNVQLIAVCLVVLCWFGATQATSCKVDEIPTMENFDKTKMMGVWYETYWAPPHFEKPEEVWYAFAEVLSASDDPDTVAVRAFGRPINATKCGSFDKVYKKSDDEALAKWWSPRYVNESYSFPLDQWVIETDYTSYSLAYGCTIVSEVTGECDHPAVWVWSRTQSLTDDAKKAVKDLLPSICVTFDDLTEMPIEEECPREPDDVSGASEVSITLSGFLTLVLLSIITK